MKQTRVKKIIPNGVAKIRNLTENPLLYLEKHWEKNRLGTGQVGIRKSQTEKYEEIQRGGVLRV